jgi:DinB family protein
MTNVVYCDPAVTGTRSSRQASALAERLEQGARALAALASSVTDAQWQTRIPHDGRTVGVVVHHVASMYPIEMQVALTIAEGKPVTGLTWAVVDGINGKHAAENEGVTRQAAIELLRRNSAEAAAAIRCLTDEQLARAVPVSLYADAPLTCQFFIEDHAMRHSYHHLAKIQGALDARKG